MDGMGLDPDLLLEWLQSRDASIQLESLNTICTMILFSDNVDRLFDQLSPRRFIPALARLFLIYTNENDILSKDPQKFFVLETAARALTNYLDVSVNCSKRLVAVTGSLTAMSKIIESADLSVMCQKDIAEQLVKAFEFVSSREPDELYQSGALRAVLKLIKNGRGEGANNNRSKLFPDTVKSAMNIINRLVIKFKPSTNKTQSNENENEDILLLADLSIHNPSKATSFSCLRCVNSILEQLARSKKPLPEELTNVGGSETSKTFLRFVIQQLENSVDEEDGDGSQNKSNVSGRERLVSGNQGKSPNQAGNQGSNQVIATMVNLIFNILTKSKFQVSNFNIAMTELGLSSAVESVICYHRESKCKQYVCKLIDRLIEFHQAETETSSNSPSRIAQIYQRSQKELIECIKSKDTEAVIDAIEGGQFGVNWQDEVGQTLMNWCCSFGSPEMVEYLCQKDAEVMKNSKKSIMGEKSNAIHYAVQFGREDVLEILLKYRPNMKAKDDMGQTVDDKMESMKLKYPTMYKMISEYAEEDSAKITEIFEESDLENKTESKAEDKIENKNDNRTENKTENKTEINSETLPDLVTEETPPSTPAKASNQISRELAVKFASGILPVIIKSCEENPDTKTQLSLLDCIERILHLLTVNEVSKVLTSEKNCAESLADCLYKCTSIDIEDFESLLKEETALKQSTPKAPKQQRAFLTTSNGTILLPYDSFISHRSRNQHSESEQQALESQRLNASLHQVSLQISELILQKGKSKVLPFIVKIGLVKKLVDQADFYKNLGKTRGSSKTDGSASVEISSPFCELDDEAQCNVLNRSEVKMSSVKLSDRQVAIRLLQMCLDLVDQFKLDGNEVDSEELSGLKKVCADSSELSFEQVLNQLAGPFSAFDLISSGILEVLTEKMEKLELLENGFFTDSGVENNIISTESFENEFDPAVIKSLVKIVEACEKVPVYEFCADNTITPIQRLENLRKVLKLTLKKKGDCEKLVDYKNVIKVEPIVLGGNLQEEVFKMVERQWFEYPREQWIAAKKIQNDHIFIHRGDFDKNGVIYHLGSNAKQTINWVNPIKSKVMFATTSDGHRLPYGSAENLIDRCDAPKNNHTSNTEDSWIAFDLGVQVIPTGYTLRHARGYAKSALRTWSFLASEDCETWVSLKDHKKDASLGPSSKTKTWKITGKSAKTGYRYFKIQQKGFNSSGMTHYISVSGFEIYGKICNSEVLEWPGLLESKVHKETVEKLETEKLAKIKKEKEAGTANTGLARTSGLSRNFIGNSFLQETESRSDSFGFGGFDDDEDDNDGNEEKWSDEEPSSNILRKMFARTFSATSKQEKAKKDAIKKIAEKTEALKEIEKRKLEVENQMKSTKSLVDKTAKKISSLKNELNKQAERALSTGDLPSASGIPTQSNLTKSTGAVSQSQLEAIDEDENSPNKPGNDLVVSLPEINEIEDDKMEKTLSNLKSQKTGQKSMPAQSVPCLSVISEPELKELKRSSNAKDIPDEVEKQTSAQSSPIHLSSEHAATSTQSLPTIPKSEETTSANNSMIASPDPLSLIFDEMKLKEKEDDVMAEFNKKLIEDETSDSDDDDDDDEEEDDDDDDEDDDDEDEDDENIYNEDDDYYGGSNDDLQEINFLETMVKAMQGASAEKKSGGKKISLSTKNPSQAATNENSANAPISILERLLGLREEIFDRSLPSVRASGERNRANETKFSSGHDGRILRYRPDLLRPYDPRPGRPNAPQTYSLKVQNNPQTALYTKKTTRDPKKLCKLTLSIKFECDKPATKITIKTDETLLSAILRSYEQFYNNQSRLCLQNISKIQDIFNSQTKREIVLEYEEDSDSSSEFDSASNLKTTVGLDKNAKMALELLKSIYRKHQPDDKTPYFSNKLSAKLHNQITEGISNASQALPNDIHQIATVYPFLLNEQLRQQYVKLVGCGFDRAVTNFQDYITSQSTSDSTTVQDSHTRYINAVTGPSDFARIRIHRAQVSRASTNVDDAESKEKHVESGLNFLKQAVNVMKSHGLLKSKLEFQFENEQGTGLGPTVEFYNLCASFLRLKSTGMWMNREGDTDMYHTENLFPEPKNNLSKLESEYFWFLGALFGKIIMDSRIVDLPISVGFLKILLKDCENINRSESLNSKMETISEIDPIRSKFVVDLDKMTDHDLSAIDLNFTFNTDEQEIVENGRNIVLNSTNKNSYQKSMVDFITNKGLKNQIEQFWLGFEMCLPKTNLYTLCAGDASLLKIQLCGQSVIEWNFSELIDHIEPKLGYTKSSKTFVDLCEILTEMDNKERKQFMMFVTGCSSLPPGGLAALQPKMVVVKKIGENGSDVAGLYPSVNTCQHYLKLPSYECKELLRKRLLAATLETGFYFN